MSFIRGYMRSEKGKPGPGARVPDNKYDRMKLEPKII